ncbi:hypothetical protein GQ607_012397 [Colletotrichum asianum]|uniref:Uncharacterized protein n=1 Tax=Colletotrichum asianum TaxID=702518 RepID=A0A8H3W6Y1_9PEZI|nr:hypothetical protein GQ607_012397 [Colletotrichum asianum]
MSRPIRIPAMIRDLAKQAGVPVPKGATFKGAAVSDNNQPSSYTNFVTQELQQAYWNADYDVINTYQSKTSSDLNPIFTSIQQNGVQAFSLVQDTDGTPYYLAYSGTADSPTGYMWSYTDPMQQALANGSAAASPPPVYNSAVSCGTLSMTGQMLGVSSWIFSSPVLLIPSVLALAVAKIVFNAVKKQLAGDAAEVAIEDASTEASSDLVAEGAVDVAAETAMADLFVAAATGLIVGAIIFFLVLFIVNFIFKNFQLQFRIFNWDDQHAWAVQAEFGSNEIISGGFKTAQLSKSSSTVKLPNGFVIPAANQEVAYANYVFQNDVTFANGVGVALEVGCDDGNGFGAKYIVHFLTDNQMGFSGTLGSVQDFYNGSWMDSSTMKYLGTVSGNNTPVYMSTPAVSGSENDVYYIDVHIGRQGPPPPPPSSLDAKPSGGPKLRAGKPLVKFQPPSVGTKIKLPSGQSIIALDRSNK